MLGGLRSTNCTALVMCAASVPANVGLTSAFLWYSLLLAYTEDEPPPWITADWRTSCGQLAIWSGLSENLMKDPQLFRIADAKFKKMQMKVSMVGHTGEAKVEVGATVRRTS